MTHHRSRWQFSLRELVAVTLIIALSCAFWRERVLHRRAIERLNSVQAHVWIWSPAPLEKYRADIANVAVAGVLYLNEQERFRKDVTVQLQLVNAADMSVVREAQARVNYSETGYHQFVANLTQPDLSEGTYLIVSECFVGDKLVTRGSVAFETTPPPSARPRR